MTNKTEMVSVPRELLESALVVVTRNCTSNWSSRIKEELTAALAAPAEDVRAVVEEPVGKYAEVLGPFTRLMERELHSNAYKGDRPAWLKMSAGECLLEIYYHAGKLHKAVHGGDCAGMQEYAADVANLSMMLTDITGALALFAKDAVEELNKL